jgi:hypothetical protein
MIRYFPVLCLLVACSGETTESPTDAGTDSATATIIDAGSEASTSDAGGDAAVCDIGTAPANVPPVTSEVFIVGADAGTVPASTGGDVTGTWISKKITLYFPSSASGQIDPSKCKVTGTAWQRFENGTAISFSDTETTIATNAVGTLVRGTKSKRKGSYAVSGAELTLTPICQEVTGDQGQSNAKTQFTRLSATTARFVVEASSQLGTLFIVSDAELVQ